MKPIINFPGYYIDESGGVWSDRQSITLLKKPIKVNDGRVNIYQQGKVKRIKVSDLYMTAYKRVLTP